MWKKRLLLCAATSVVAVAGIGSILAWQPRTAPPDQGELSLIAAQGKDDSPDEAALRKIGADFIKAFNAGDAKAVASFWTKDGEFLQADGDELKGRDAIQ